MGRPVSRRVAVIRPCWPAKTAIAPWALPADGSLANPNGRAAVVPLEQSHLSRQLDRRLKVGRRRLGMTLDSRRGRKPDT